MSDGYKCFRYWTSLRDSTWWIRHIQRHQWVWTGYFRIQPLQVLSFGRCEIRWKRQWWTITSFAMCLVQHEAIYSCALGLWCTTHYMSNNAVIKSILGVWTGFSNVPLTLESTELRPLRSSGNVNLWWEQHVCNLCLFASVNAAEQRFSMKSHGLSANRGRWRLSF